MYISQFKLLHIFSKNVALNLKKDLQFDQQCFFQCFFSDDDDIYDSKHPLKGPADLA